MLIAAVLLLVITLAAGALFLVQRNDAQEAARLTKVRELAGESTLALTIDPELSTLLALEAVKLSRQGGDAAQIEAIAALQEAVQASRIELRRPIDDSNWHLVASDSGGLLAMANPFATEATVWDAGRGEVLRPLTGTGDGVSGLAFAPSSSLVALSYSTQEQDDTPRDRPAVIVWDAAKGVEISRLRGPARVYSSPTFGPDGRTLAALATADENTTVVVWDVITGIERFSTTPLPDGAFSVTFHPDGRSFFVPDFGGIRRYSADDGREIESLSTPGFQPDRVVPDPMGARIAISSQLSRAVQVRDLATENPPLTIPVGDVTSIDWSPNGERLAIGSGNQGPIRVVDVSSGEDAMILRGHIGGAADVAFVSDERLASVGSDELRVWNVSDAGPADLGAVASELGRTHSVVEFSPDGSEMAVIVRNNGDMLQFFSTTGPQPLRSPLTDRLEFSGIIISPDWRLLASVAADGRGVVQDLGSLTELQELPECAGPSAFSPDGSLLVLDGKSLCTPAEGGTLTASPGTNLRSRVVDTATGELVLDLNERVILSSQFNPEGRFEAGRYLAVAFDDDVDVVEIYDVATHELVADLERPMSAGVTFDPSGRWLFGGTWDGNVWVLDLAAVIDGTSPEQAIVFERNTSKGATRAALSADGILATSGNGEGLMRLWDVTTGELVLEFRTDRTDGPNIGSGWMAFSPDGSYLAYVDGDGVLRRYLMDTDQLIELAEARLTRGSPRRSASLSRFDRVRVRDR